MRPKVVWHPHPAPRPSPVARRPLQLRFLRFFCAIFSEAAAPSAPIAAVPELWRARAAGGLVAHPPRVTLRTRGRSGALATAGAPRLWCTDGTCPIKISDLGLGFVLSRARPIASAPGPLERVCGERSGCSLASSHSPGARSVGCPGCRVGALFVVHVVKFMSIHIRSSCVFLRLFVVL